MVQGMLSENQFSEASTARRSTFYGATEAAEEKGGAVDDGLARRASASPAPCNFVLNVASGLRAARHLATPAPHPASLVMRAGSGRYSSFSRCPRLSETHHDLDTTTLLWHAHEPQERTRHRHVLAAVGQDAAVAVAGDV